MGRYRAIARSPADGRGTGWPGGPDVSAGATHLWHADRRQCRYQRNPRRRPRRRRPHRALPRAPSPSLDRRQRLQGRRNQRPARHAGRVRGHWPQPRTPSSTPGTSSPTSARRRDDAGRGRGRGTIRRTPRATEGGERAEAPPSASGADHPSRTCSARARRSWSRSPRNRSGPRAPASRRSSRLPGRYVVYMPQAHHVGRLAAHPGRAGA